MVHHLIDAYDLAKDFTLIEPEPATEDDIRLFHSSEYVDYLKTQCDGDDVPVVDYLNQTNDMLEDVDEDDEDDQELHLEYGIGN